MNKKVLIIGVSFNDAFGGGVTLKNLFSQFRPEQIGVVDFSITILDFKYSHSLYNISDNSTVNLNATAIINKNVPNEESSLSAVKISKSIKKSLIFLMIRKYFSYYYNNYSKITLSNSLDIFINSFNPDYLYIVPYNRRIIDLALKINSLKGIPIVTHFMDDFRKRSPLDLFYPINEQITKHLTKRLVQKSYKCLAICESMAKEYEILFSKKFHYFHNPINIDLFRNHFYQTREKDNTLKILYSGTIAENNCDTLIMFSEICEQIGKKDKNIIFNIYAPVMHNNIFYKKLNKAIFDYEFVNLNESISHDKIIPLMFHYDMLFLPLTFNKKYINVIKISFPTKVAEYMASAIPTLYVIPRGIALHDYISENNFGHLIDKLDADPIKDFLILFKNDAGMQVEDLRAKEIAFRDFHIADVASKFKAIFS